ncbi:MAG: hypothetical protein ACI8YQ_004057, partial [Polaribacter sp.]
MRSENSFFLLTLGVNTSYLTINATLQKQNQQNQQN